MFDTEKVSSPREKGRGIGMILSLQNLGHICHIGNFSYEDAQPPDAGED